MGLAATVVLSLTGGAAAQVAPLEVMLRDGTVLAARALTGDPSTGFVAELGAQRRRIDANDLVAVHGGPASVPPMPAAQLAGGDVVRGVVVDGDEAGNRFDLLSPVLGRVPIAVDRLEALVNAGAAPHPALRLPDGVGEALFVRAATGYDVVAGTLHQFGEAGVRFQPDGAPARWYRSEEYAALRLAEATPRAVRPPVALLTRTGDRVGVTLQRCTAEGASCTLEGGTAVTVKWGDVASLSFVSAAVFASDLTPSEVEESGYAGEVVHPWRRDHNALGAPLVTAGRTHGKGFGVHAQSRLCFQVPAGCERFWTRVGFDDSVAALRLEPQVDVRVLVNGKVVFEQKAMAANQQPHDTRLLPVRPGDTVALEVDFGRGRDLGDRVNWLSPVFLPAPPRRP